MRDDETHGVLPDPDVARLISEMADVLEDVDAEELDQWERES